MKMIALLERMVANDPNKTIVKINPDEPNERPEPIGCVLCGKLIPDQIYVVEVSHFPSMNGVADVMGTTSDGKSFWWGYRIE